MRLFSLFAVAAALTFAGCASTYTTPGGAADFAKLGMTPEVRAGLSNPNLREILDRKPTATFPVTIVTARVQAANYNPYQYGNGHLAGAQGSKYSVITTREIEKDEDFEQIAKLPGVRGLAPVSRVLLDESLTSDEQLRAAALKVQGGMLLYYTFDTAFHTDRYVQPLGVITLGIFPTEKPSVTCTASAVLMDTFTGYVYAVSETTVTNDQLANAWSSSQAMDEVRRKTEREAFTKLVKEFRDNWGNVYAAYKK